MGFPPREVPPTRRDAAVPETRRDGAPAGFGGLPPSLAEAYEVVRPIGTQGAEADLLVVRDRSGGEFALFALKVYRPGYRADPAVWSAVRGLRSRHIVRVLRTGEAAGRDFELQEYVPGGTLAELLRRGPVDTVRVVAQLADALGELHGLGAVHRDLKPANVLVRGTEPLDLVLADFGLSRGIDASIVFGTASRTLAYAPPESFSGAVSRAWDWWSLGVLVLELATGRSPFEGMTEQAVMHHLLTRSMDVEQVADPRLRLLCRGLLLRDPAARWGGEQVAQWLAGGAPPVAEDSGPRGDGTRVPLLFLGEHYTARVPLARAMAARWDDAARRFLVTMGTQDHPSEGWGTLRAWLRQFDDPASDDVEGRQELIDLRLTSAALSPDVKLLYLLYWLDPSLPPLYRGMAMTTENLLELAASALARPREGQAVMADLWTHHLLPVLAGLTGAEELRGVDARWRQLDAAFPADGEFNDGKFNDGEFSDGEFDVTRVRGGLLALALDEHGTAQTLRRATEEVRASLPVPVPWFDELLDSGEPARLLAAHLSTGAARGWAENEARRRAQQRAADLARQQRWRELEERREAGRIRAVSWAALAVGIFSVLWLVVLWLADALPQDTYDVRTRTFVPAEPSIQFLVMVVVWLSLGLAEIVMALQIAGEYHPRYSLLGPLGRIAAGARGPAGAMRSLSQLAAGGRGGLVAAAVIFIFLLIVINIVAGLLVQFLILPVGVAVAYGLWTHRRWQTWERELAQARTTTLGGNA
ncbi:hypothetical protein Aph01nite_64400 [Acrocarpospora phusangensis]|uniref:Protein kinase domain-containing protein n=1 Tax=Acrocarpospora phusangensis TaxID=1070424 RepID=A0A919UU67_9ACTN|nr:serine/threonine-protein kinase [Acrocarpospora phusangensis]GIH28130.1 hypothetical protein Aph01nite_64400 [Acrocarpospora phusangensis]